MAEQFSRRQILRALALGGAVVAGELWIPGQRLISIPRMSEEERFVRERFAELNRHYAEQLSLSMIQTKEEAAKYTLVRYDTAMAMIESDRGRPWYVDEHIATPCGPVVSSDQRFKGRSIFFPEGLDGRFSQRSS